MITEKTKDRFAEIEQLARAAGLDPYDVHFFEVPASLIYEVASYGLPTRYSHWSFGKSYQHQRTQGEMGFSKIYELILNNDPSYAFLDKSNSETINLMIAAHCLGHSDVFKNNVMFRRCGETNMIHVAKRHAEIIDQFRSDYGDDEVDDWLDIALALERHIDVYLGVKRERYSKRHVAYEERIPTDWEDIVYREPKPIIKKVMEGIYLPPHPERDVLWFLSEYANLEPWQQKIFQIVRRESYYFFPQFLTKVTNEGWACLSKGSKVLTNKGLLSIEQYNTQDNDNTKCHNGNNFTNRSHTHITKSQQGLSILTNRGITVCGANNHKVQLHSGEFVKLSELKIGDLIKMSYGHDVWNKQTQFVKPDYIPHNLAPKSKTKIFNEVQIDENFAQFLAFWIGEGCVSKNRGVYIRNSNLKCLQNFAQYISDRFGIDGHIREIKDVGSLRYNLEFYSRALYELLQQICEGHSTARYKKIPEVIFQSPKTIVQAFLRSLFDAEGCVYNKTCNRKAVIFTSASQQMINDVAVLLSNFGILCVLRLNKKQGYDDVYQIVISSSDLLLFAKNIGFNDPKKAEKLRSILDGCTRNNTQKRFYAKVRSINKSEEQEFYDFTVPDNHTYIANGLVHHNSYWHAELMMQYFLGNDNDYGVKIKHPLTEEEHLDFASAHEKVVQPGLKMKLKIEQEELDDFGRPTGRKIKRWNPRANGRAFSAATRLNPYYVGFKMFRYIKEQWDKYYEQGYREDEWGTKIPVTITGNQKIREVMMEEDDVSFFRNYLTEELVEKLHLFTYGSTENYDDNYEVQEEIRKRLRDNQENHLGQIPIDDQYIKNKTIQVHSKETKSIINRWAAAHSNYGVPSIVVRRVDESGTLRLEHLVEDSVNLDIAYAEHVIKYIYKVWGRPVELIRRDVKNDKTRTISYDGMNLEIDFSSSDYPECIEEKQSPSSW